MALYSTVIAQMAIIDAQFLVQLNSDSTMTCFKIYVVISQSFRRNCKVTQIDM